MTKRPVGLTWILGSTVAQLGRDHWLDDHLDDVVAQPVVGDVVVVLSGDYHRSHRDGLAAAVFDRHLRLAVRPEVVDQLLVAHLGETSREAMREGDRQWHQLGRLAAGEAEHHALVAGALIVDVRPAACLERLVDAALDVGRLLVDRDQRPAGSVVEAEASVGVADPAHGVANDGLEVDVGVGRDLADDHHRAGRGGRLTGDSGARVVADDRVEDCVRDLVAHLVRVTLGHRFGGEQVLLVVDDAGHLAPRVSRERGFRRRLAGGSDRAPEKAIGLPLAGCPKNGCTRSCPIPTSTWRSSSTRRSASRAPIAKLRPNPHAVVVARRAGHPPGGY